MVACFDGYIHLLVGEQLNKGAYESTLRRQRAAAELTQQHLKQLFISFAVAQYVGLAQGIQGIFGALSAVPGTW